MNVPLYIAKRYSLKLSKNNAINIITGIATISIIVSAMALFVVLSVFSGMREFSLQFTNETDPDLKIFPSQGKSFFITPLQEQQIKSVKNIAKFSKTIEERVLFRFANKEMVAYVKGVDTGFLATTTFKKYLVDGTWLTPQSSEAVLGAGIVQKLSIGMFDMYHNLTVYVPKAGKGIIETPDQAFTEAILEPVGMYMAQNEEIDYKYVFVSIEQAQDLLNFKQNQITHLEIKLKNNSLESETKADLEKILDAKIRIKNRNQLNDVLYKMLNSENIVVYLIFTLVIIIAMFNLIGALIMMIIDKKNNLKTLYNLGIELHQLKKVFIFQGFMLSLVGALIGLLLGSVLVWLQLEYQALMITDTLAYPVVFSGQNLLLVVFTIAFLGFLASYIASRSVTKKLVST